MNNSELKAIYFSLKRVYCDGAFSQLALNEGLEAYSGDSSALVTKTVYGVLDNDLYLRYLIDSVTNKKPKASVMIVLKIGAYMLRFLDIAQYAVVNNIVEFMRSIGKSQLCGFVNAVLKKLADAHPDLPGGDAERLSVLYSYPLWFVKKCLSEYGADAEKILKIKPDERTHVRINSRKISSEGFEALLRGNGVEFEASKIGGYYLSYGKLITAKIDDSLYAVQSAGSEAVCRAVNASSEDLVLDVCAAPGGKSVNISAAAKSVTACDLYPHRAELIKKYASKMGAENVFAEVCDATKRRKTFVGAFDKVLCDVPCSGFGVAYSRPDIKMNRKAEDMDGICSVQRAILDNCSEYVKRGGKLIYSTCTVLEEENRKNIAEFLRGHDNFAEDEICLGFQPKLIIGKSVQLLPFCDGTEGFFISVLRRVR